MTKKELSIIQKKKYLYSLTKLYSLIKICGTFSQSVIPVLKVADLDFMTFTCNFAMIIPH